MMSLDWSKQGNLSPVSVNVGFGEQLLIKKLPTVNQKEGHEFRKAACNVIKECIEKLCERSPLKYRLTRAISFFSPILIGTVDSKVMKKRFATLLEILSESGWVSTVATKEYKILLDNKDFLEKAKAIDVKSQRVNDFYATVLSKGKDYQDLWFVTKKVIILPHGNGWVETGFLINEDLLNDNWK